MGRNLISNLIIALSLIIAQVLICNHIVLFNTAMVFIFIYIIISLPTDVNRSVLLTWAFLSGFTVDIFSDTLGLNAFAATILAVAKQPILFAYIPKDDRTKSFEPNLQSLGFADYSKYLISMTLLFSAIIFSIEFISFASFDEIILMILSSGLLSYVVILAIDSIVRKK